MSILLLRHAQTDANNGPQKVVRGQLDYPLNAQGHIDAQSAATRLKALQDSGVTFRRILSCDLTRCRQTAEPVGDALGLPIFHTPALRTWGMGPDYEGHPVDADIGRRIKSLVESPYRIPYQGESYASQGARLSGVASPFLNDPDADKGVDIFVTHGQPIRYYDAWTQAGQRGVKFDPTVAANINRGAEHAGMALMAPGRFEYIDAKPSQGLS